MIKAAPAQSAAINAIPRDWEVMKGLAEEQRRSHGAQLGTIGQYTPTLTTGGTFPLMAGTSVLYCNAAHGSQSYSGTDLIG